MAATAVYVDSACPSCNRSQESDPVPLYLTVGILFFVLIVLAYIYVQYLLAQQQAQNCQRYLDHRVGKKQS